MAERVFDDRMGTAPDGTGTAFVYDVGLEAAVDRLLAMRRSPVGVMPQSAEQLASVIGPLDEDWLSVRSTRGPHR